ncbi:MAG: cytoplasmic protein [Myxococcota bacterium]|nr:cytoplasmic protein [Myxococcota bacterium]
MKKIVLFAFNGEPMCFAHVLLNAFDMIENDYDARIVMEGSATRLVKDLHEDESLPFAKLYKKAVAAGLIDAVCDACSGKMGSKESAIKQGLKLIGEMSGHPSIARYLEEGFEVMTF